MGKTVNNSSLSPASLSRIIDSNITPEQILELQQLPDEFDWRQALGPLTPERELKESYLEPYLVRLLDQISALKEPDTFNRLRPYLPALSSLGAKQPPSGSEMREALVAGQIAEILAPLGRQVGIDLQPLVAFGCCSLVDLNFQRAVGRVVGQTYYAVQQAYPNEEELPSENISAAIIGVGLPQSDDYFHVRLADLQRDRASDDEQLPGSTHQQLSISRLIHNLNTDIGYGLVAIAHRQGASFSELGRRAQRGKFALLDRLIATYN